MATIEVHGVTVRSGSTTLVEDLDITVTGGEVVGVVGPSGSGKTTLLRLLAGLTRPTDGRMSFDGATGPPAGFVTMALQDDPVYGHLDVGGNLGFPIDMARSHDPAERAARIDQTASRMGLRRLLTRRPDGLSGGERAAVSVGRALAAPRARFMLLDEPMAKADARRREGFRSLVRRIRSERPDLGMVIATNDQNDILGLVDTLVVMHGGTIAQIGAPDRLSEEPVDVRVAGFLGTPPMNLFPSVLDRWRDGLAWAIGSDHIPVDHTHEPAPPELVGRPVIVGVRPEHLTIAGPEVPFERTIHVSVGWVEEPTATVWFGLGGVGSMAYAFQARGTRRPATGDRLELTWAPDRTRIFDAESGRAIPKSIIGSAD